MNEYVENGIFKQYDGTILVERTSESGTRRGIMTCVDLSAYSKKMFQMFGGEEAEVSVEFDNQLVGVVFDRFGTNIPIIKTDDEHFVCHVKVAATTQFLSWIISFGQRAKILSPETVVCEMKRLLASVTELYDK